MTKHLVNWKAVICKNVAGHDYEAELAGLVDIHYKGTLLARILAMKEKRPITYDQAVRLLEHKFFGSEIGCEPDKSHWFIHHFVEWISGLGYHIELTGDEFEAWVQFDKVS